MMRPGAACVVVMTTVLLAGCAGMQPASLDAQREFTYDFSVPGKSQNDLWRSARDFFAEAYGDSRAVFRVVDEQDGTLFGRGLASWPLTPLGRTMCITEYHIRFAAKDGKARLQFELIEGVPALSQCTGWPWPSEDGYKKITDSFAKNAESLELALQGKGTKSKLKDF